MPRYDYKCDAGHKYELQQPFGSPEEHPCQKCGRLARRLLVAPPLIFKTGGYYKSSERDFHAERGPSTDGKPAKPDVKADAKPAAKKDTPARPAGKGASTGKPAAKAPAPSKPAASKPASRKHLS